MEQVITAPMGEPLARNVMAIVFAGETEAQAAERVVDRFIENLGPRRLRIGLVIAGIREGQVVTGVVGVASPGRLVLAFIPAESLVYADGLTRDVLRQAIEGARAQGAVLIQVLIESTESRRGAALESAGFEKLATLVYLERLVSPAPPIGQRSALDVELCPYTEVGDAVLGPALASTYEGSLDCPGLNGARTLEDILAAHRSAGRHDPGMWWVAKIGGIAAGVLLLSPNPDSPLVELVYMGVVPEFRGRGVADVMLRHARQACVERRLRAMTLAVDSTNHFARALYRRWGFREIGARDAWVAFPQRISGTIGHGS